MLVEWCFGTVQKEQQVIVNNYYISDREKGWKWLEEGKIPPNTSDNTTRNTTREILPKTRANTEERNLQTNQETKNVDNTQEVREQKRYYAEEAETQNMAPPETRNFNYPHPVMPTEKSETSAMLDCI